jgi:phosphate transport system substrate-binding protein
MKCNITNANKLQLNKRKTPTDRNNPMDEIIFKSVGLFLSVGKCFLICALFALQGCSTTRPLTDIAPVIRIKGSDTMVILAQRWAEEYMKQHTGIAVYVEGGGSAAGIEALINGEIEICTASRPLQAAEVQRLAQRHQNIGIAFRVAKDGLSVYLHPDNPIRDLSLEQLKDIYTGKIKNWREAGGKDQAIIALSREPSSGTYLYFQEHVLEGQPFGENVILMPTTAAIAAGVEKNPQAIGYGGVAYGKNLVHCQINGVSPSDESVREDKYPIARYLYFYTIKKPDTVVKSFIDWVLGKEGQRVVKEVGYIPLFEMP